VTNSTCLSTHLLLNHLRELLTSIRKRPSLPRTERTGPSPLRSLKHAVELLTIQTPSEMFQKIRHLNEGVRTAQIFEAGQLDSTPPTQQQTARTSLPRFKSEKSRWPKLLDGTLHGLFGLALIGANNTALAATLGLTVPLTVLSTGLGTIACDRGYNAFSDAIFERD